MAETPNPLWITEADVARLMDMRDAIVALEAGFREEAAGHAANMAKTHLLWDGGSTMHAIGAVFHGPGISGTKSWTNAGARSTPLVTLWNSRDGSLLAIIEASLLGQLRTGASAGLATRWLAEPGADALALIGAGKQAMMQLAAVAAVRKLRRVRVWSRGPERSAAFAATAARELGLKVEPAATVAAAAKGAAIVTLVTRATEPLLSSAMVARGAHVNAVGAITPERREFEPALLARCATVMVDSLPQVRQLSSEFAAFYGNDEAAWGRVQTLADVARAGASRPAGADVTLAKPMGVGISDLSLAIEILQRATARSLGRPFPHPAKAQPRLRAPQTEGADS